MRGVTKEERFPVKYNGTINSRRGKKAGFKVTGTVNRMDYGHEFNRTMDDGGLVVGEEVEIICRIELNESTQ